MIKLSYFPFGMYESNKCKATSIYIFMIGTVEQFQVLNDIQCKQVA